MYKKIEDIEYLFNQIPGIVSIFKILDGKFLPVIYSEELCNLCGMDKQTFKGFINDDFRNLVINCDTVLTDETVKKVIEGEEIEIIIRLYNLEKGRCGSTVKQKKSTASMKIH